MASSDTDEIEVSEDVHVEHVVSKKKLKKLAEESETYNPVKLIYEPLRDFAHDSVRMINKCTKPDAKGVRLREIDRYVRI